MVRIALVIATLVTLASAAYAQYQGTHCTSTRVGNTTYTNCY